MDERGRPMTSPYQGLKPHSTSCGHIQATPALLDMDNGPARGFYPYRYTETVLKFPSRDGATLRLIQSCDDDGYDYPTDESYEEAPDADEFGDYE